MYKVFESELRFILYDFLNFKSFLKLLIIILNLFYLF